MIIRVQNKFGTWRLKDLEPESTIADVIKLLEAKPACSGLCVSTLCLPRVSKDSLERAATLSGVGLKEGDLLRAEFKAISAVIDTDAASRGTDGGISDSSEQCIDLTSSPASCCSSPVRKKQRKNDSVGVTTKPGRVEEEVHNKLRFLTYNVWFDSLESERRTREQLYIIRKEKPAFIAFQELLVHTAMFLKNNLSRDGYHFYAQDSRAPYFCALASRFPLKVDTMPFENSKMGRGLLIGEAEVGSRTVVVATTHLESPIPPFKGPSMMIEQRKEQVRKSLCKLRDRCKKFGTRTLCVLMGDMNWKDKECGEIPAKAMGFKDAWVDRMGSEPGYTYDGRSNQMLTNYLRARLDRIFVGEEAVISTIRLVGTEPIKDTTYVKTVGRQKQRKVLPVLPSDHFGLLAVIENV